jgi:ubiquinone biosynthesis UbiH/UbiF/VisC/COQ6 family hydroxylase
MDAAFEVAVAGGGMIGLAAARAMRGRRVALVAPAMATAPAAAGFDSRVYAISPANAAFLARIGAWEAMSEAQLTPIRAMRVHGDDGSSTLAFDAYRSGVAELAWIVEDRRLQEALARNLEAQPGLTVYGGAPLRELTFAERSADLLLEDGRRLAASLVVGADGARSVVRTQSGIAVDAQPYGHTAVVANFACERPHRNVAYQWFQGAAGGGAVLALLPLPGNHVSMVWSTRAEHAARLCSLDGEALAREVAIACGRALGDLSVVTPARGFVLQRLQAARLAAPRVALAGDAAHVLHPLAGQGANLGLQDVQVLADVLATAEPGRDPGDLRLLRRYERARAEAILSMRTTVHGLFRLFDAPGPATARLRNSGLNLADRLPVLKNLLMRHAMG